MWFLACFVAVFAARYFLTPPPWLVPPIVPESFLHDRGALAAMTLSPNLYYQHRLAFLLHVAGGIVALVTGLFQFIATLRASRPRLHRVLGRVYVAAVLLGGSIGLPLSFLTLGALPMAIRGRFLPMAIGTATLAVAWLCTGLIAYRRARERRFDEHRAWMTRSYSLTFAAVTVRLVAPILLLATGDPVLALNGGFLSWPLNLVVAEWLLQKPIARKPAADAT